MVGKFSSDLLTGYKGFVAIKKKVVKLSKTANFFQEPHLLEDGRYINLYWTEFDKKRTKFRLQNILGRKSIVQMMNSFVKSTRVEFASVINTCNFYLVDVGNNPIICAYNLFVVNGEVLQFPCNTRTTLIETGGVLNIVNLEAYGKLRIGKQAFSWSGKKSGREKSDILVHGIFDVMFAPVGEDLKRRPRQPIKSTLKVICEIGKILLGVGLDRKDRPVVKTINNGELQLNDYCYIFEISQKSVSKINIGDPVSGVVVDDYSVKANDNIVSLSFSLPKDYRGIRNEVSRQILKANGTLKPLMPDYFKAWSLVLTTNKSVIFFLADCYPYIDKQIGINIFELHKILTSKFDFETCGVCDGGQTSKLCVKSGNSSTKVYGNMHYVNYSKIKPMRDGVRGRPVPSALIAYARTT